VRRAHFGRKAEEKRIRDRVARGAAVADLDPADGHRANAGLDGALGATAVSDQTLAAVRQLQVPHAGQEGFGLQLDGLGQ
jgi:hypothetical protein